MFAFIVLVFVVVFSSFLGYLVVRSNPQSSSNRWFGIFSLSIVFWSAIMYLSLAVTQPQWILFYIRLSMLAGTLLAVSGFIFAYTFPAKTTRFPRVLSYAFSILTPLTMAVSMSPYMFTNLVIEGNNIEPTPGPGILLFVITAIGSVIGMFVVLIFKFIKAKSLERTKYFFMILGIFTMFMLLVTTNFLTVVLLKDSSFIFLAPVYPVIFLASTAYAILRHRILDIKFLIIRAITYALSLSFLTIFFALIFFLMTSLFTGLHLALSDVVIFIISSIIFALLFQPIKRVFEIKTERFFYRNTYQTSTVLSELGAAIASTIVFSHLINKIGDIFTKALKSATFSVFLFDESKSFGEQDLMYKLDKKYDKGNLLKFLKHVYKNGPRIIFYDEEESQKIKDVLDLYQVSVILPLVSRGKTIGAYLVGPKSSGDSYSQRDLDMMGIISPQLAVGIQNALSYEEIRSFNVTLQEKVDKATASLKESNIKLKDSYEKLQQLDKLKDEFVSIASHELRTPLTAIKGYLWLAINKSPKPLPTEVLKNLQIAHSSSERLSVMVEDMLTISRIEGNRLKLEKTKFNINDLVQEVYNELAIRASGKSIQFEFIHDEKILNVEADREKIRECLINLVGNAMKFTPENGKVSISTGLKESFVFVSISDNGPGISKDDQKKLFQKFSRMEHSYEKTKESGTGLGLYITKQIIDLHSGNITVESQLSKGTTFTMTLPAKA